MLLGFISAGPFITAETPITDSVRSSLISFSSRPRMVVKGTNSGAILLEFKPQLHHFSAIWASSLASLCLSYLGMIIVLHVSHWFFLKLNELRHIKLLE